MLADGADVNRRMSIGENLRETPALMEAAAVGSLEIMRLLLTAGAKVNLQDFRGDTALHQLLRNNWVDDHKVMAILLAYGVDVTSKTKKAIHRVCRHKDVITKWVKALGENGQQWCESFFADYLHTD